MGAMSGGGAGDGGGGGGIKWDCNTEEFAHYEEPIFSRKRSALNRGGLSS